MARYRNPKTGVTINIPDEKLASNPGYLPVDEVEERRVSKRETRGKRAEAPPAEGE